MSSFFLYITPDFSSFYYLSKQSNHFKGRKHGGWSTYHFRILSLLAIRLTVYFKLFNLLAANYPSFSPTIPVSHQNRLFQRQIAARYLNTQSFRHCIILLFSLLLSIAWSLRCGLNASAPPEAANKIQHFPLTSGGDKRKEERPCGEEVLQDFSRRGRCRQQFVAKGITCYWLR